MKKTFFVSLTLLLLITANKSNAQIQYEDPHFKFDKSKNASLKISDLNENLELRTPGQPIIIHKYTVTVIIDGKEKTFTSEGSKIGKKPVEAILNSKEKPTHIDFANVSFTQDDDPAKQVLKGFTLFLK